MLNYSRVRQVVRYLQISFHATRTGTTWRSSNVQTFIKLGSRTPYVYTFRACLLRDLLSNGLGRDFTNERLCATPSRICELVYVQSASWKFGITQVEQKSHYDFSTFCRSTLVKSVCVTLSDIFEVFGDKYARTAGLYLSALFKQLQGTGALAGPAHECVLVRWMSFGPLLLPRL